MVAHQQFAVIEPGRIDRISMKYTRSTSKPLIGLHFSAADRARRRGRSHTDPRSKNSGWVILFLRLVFKYSQVFSVHINAMKNHGHNLVLAEQWREVV